MALLIVLMINLAFWQLRRLDHRKSVNTAIRERSTQPATPAPAHDSLGPEWTIIAATGEYDASQQLLIDNRSLDGPGFHVVTPLKRADGEAILVNRGWIDLVEGREGRVPAPPTGPVTITARVRPTQVRGSIGPRTPAEGVLTHIARVDVARIAKQVPYPIIESEYVELSAQIPAATPPPKLIPLPELDNGPHFSYAMQWFFFSACAAAGWVIAVRKSAKQYALDSAGGADRAQMTPS